MANVSILDVQLHGETIGTLTHLQGEQILFAFTEKYIEDEQRPTLSLSFKDEFGALITNSRPVRTKVPPFFSNLLPEGPLRTYLAKQAGVKPAREFFLLWVLGRDLPGAISIRPANDEAWPPDFDEDIQTKQAETRANALRFSLAGVQLKFSAVKSDKSYKGLTIPVEGVGGSWIVKLPSSRFEGIPENEYAMMTIARRIGINVPDFDLLDLNAISGLPEGIGTLKGRAYAVSRFDRSAEGPVHIEDFAQIFKVYPDDKYDKGSYRNIATKLAIETSEEDVTEFIRRLIFSVLIGNADMHLKNWSLIYYDRRTPSLSPAYDFVSTIPYIADENAAGKFARTRRFDEFTLDELAYLAAKASLPQKPVLATARETVARFHEVWRKEIAHLPQAASVTQAVDAHLKTLPIARI